MNIRTDVGRLFLVFKLRKSSFLAKYIRKNFFIVETKCNLSTSVFIFSTIPQILRTKFYVFWTQTCRNWTKLFTWTWHFPQVSHSLKCLIKKKKNFSSSYLPSKETLCSLYSIYWAIWFYFRTLDRELSDWKKWN